MARSGGVDEREVARNLEQIRSRYDREFGEATLRVLPDDAKGRIVERLASILAIVPVVVERGVDHDARPDGHVVHSGADEIDHTRDVRATDVRHRCLDR